MPTATIRLFLNDTPASEEQLAVFGAIRVDQGMGMAAEAELDLPVGTDDAGAWQLLEDDFAQAFARIRIEVKVGEGEFVALIDGPVVAQRFQLDATPESSQMTLVVHDDSVLMNRDEAVVLFEDMSPSDIASQLFGQAGFEARVDSVPAAGGAYTRQVLQRGTPMQLLRRLAREQGCFAYVEPGVASGRSVGVFQRPLPADDALPELVLLGPQRNIGRFTAEFDALRPQAPQAASVLASDLSVVSATADAAPSAAMGDEAAFQVLTPARTLLTATREEQADSRRRHRRRRRPVELGLDGRRGSAGRRLRRRAAALPQDHRQRRRRHLSGDYLISRVNHQIGDAGYRQQFSLTRNARSAGAGAAPGVPAGVF